MGLFGDAKKAYDSIKGIANEFIGAKSDEPYNKTNGEGKTSTMKGLVQGICTQCGAPVLVDPDQEAAVCPHCGTPFIVSKAINQFSINGASISAPKVEVSAKGAVEATLDYVDKLREEKKEKKRQQEEKKRQEEEEARKRREQAEAEEKEMRKEKEARSAEKRKKFGEWFKKNGFKTIGISFLIIAIIIVIIVVSVNASRKGKIQVGVSSSQLSYNNYEYAKVKLTQSGFTDITIVADPDLKATFFNSNKDKDGQVKTVTIGTKTSFSARTYFYPDEPVIIVYHTFPEQTQSDKMQQAESSNNVESMSTPTPAPTSTPRPTPTPIPAPTVEPTTTPALEEHTNREVEYTLDTLIGTQFSSKEYKIEIEDPVVNIYFYPDGFTSLAYNAAVVGDSTSKVYWDTLVSTAKSWSTDLVDLVHEALGREDLTVVLYYCDDTGASGNVFLCVGNGTVYYDYVNGIDLLGLGG